jgi:hypothetical protein
MTPNPKTVLLAEDYFSDYKFFYIAPLLNNRIPGPARFS